MTDLLNWIRHNVPGTEATIGNELRIKHHRGGTSSLWYPLGGLTIPVGLETLGVYDRFDGADLFSSTFKVASLIEGKEREGVILTPTLRSLAAMAEQESVQFLEYATPFMTQAGIGIYGVAKSGLIFEWDLELKELTGEFENVYEILEEWLNAMAEVTS